MRRTLAVVVAALVVAVPAAGAAGPSVLPPSFRLARRGPDGGTIWYGRIPDRFVADSRDAAIYLPPGYDPTGAYPVVYFLHGFWGSPSSFVHGLRLAKVADELIAAGAIRPFVGVMPPGGPITKTEDDEWAGVWEDYVVSDVVPWTDSHLAVDPSTSGRVLAGLSAGGYGAVDIGLRHPGMFGTLESWGGYFMPFRDGPFLHATRRVLDAHDPRLLVRREAPGLKRQHTRFFLSTGGSHGSVNARWTYEYADELTRLGVDHELWVLPRAKRGHFWRSQLPAALRFALPRG